MARSRQLALVLVCGTVTIAGWDAARLGGFEWSGIENIATPMWNGGAARGATMSSTEAGLIGALLAHATASASAAIRSHRKVPEPDRATGATMDGDPSPRETAVVRGGVSAPEASAAEAALPNAHPTPPAETSTRLVSLFRPDAPEKEVQPVARPVDIVDECLVVDICIDEYLWSLYERTPKVDTNKVTEQIKTTLKTKRKTRTVTKTITKYVVADFAWASSSSCSGRFA